ncbi:hypothetical protein Hanom_Chr06g00530301 [Helianthus anomalus]
MLTIFPVFGKSTAVAASSANFKHFSSRAPSSLKSACTTCALHIVPRLSFTMFFVKKSTISC